MYVTDADYLTLRNAIQNEKIVIPLSLVLLEETLPVLKTTPFKIQAEWQILEGLVYWEMVVNDHVRLLDEDILAYAHGKSLPPRFVTLTLPPDWFFNPPQQRLLELKADIEATRKQKQDDLANMKEARRQFLKGLKFPSTGTFEEYWDAAAIPLIEKKAEDLGVLEECNERGLDGLLELRSMKLYVTWYLSYTFTHFIKGERLLHSDSRDHRHAVSASVADIFVTQDSRFARLLKRVQINRFEIIDLQTLLWRLKYNDVWEFHYGIENQARGPT
jgi:hypothetical protein